MREGVRGGVLADGRGAPGDLDLLMVTDDPADAVARIVSMVGERRREGSA